MGRHKISCNLQPATLCQNFVKIGQTVSEHRQFEVFKIEPCICVQCAVMRCPATIEVLCCIIVQQKSDELRFNGHALHSHTNARLDLENFEWVYLKDRLTDFDEIRTGGSWSKVAFNERASHEF